MRPRLPRSWEPLKRSTAFRAVICLPLVALAAMVLADGAAVRVTIFSAARTAEGRPASGYRLLPTVNGPRWSLG